MTHAIHQALTDFYAQHGFGEELGKRPKTVAVYTGCLLVPLPNIETRNKYLKYHDIHHIITGYSTGRIGEGKISAWELGTGSFFANPILGVMNLIALSTGIFLDRHAMWHAYKKGCNSSNLYKPKARKEIDDGIWSSVTDLSNLKVGNPKKPTLLRTIEFGLYVLFSILIHAMLAIPALIVRYFTDALGKEGFIKALKPVKRTDIY